MYNSTLRTAYCVVLMRCLGALDKVGASNNRALDSLYGKVKLRSRAHPAMTAEILFVNFRVCGHLVFGSLMSKDAQGTMQEEKKHLRAL